MIFALYFTSIMAGYSAVGQLLGSYIVHYTGASSMDLGFIFMLQPFTIFARPFICGHADRYQSHQKLLSKCLFLTSISYVPFIIIPYCLDSPRFNYIFTPKVCYWIFSLCHLLGSLGFCGVRSLGDALTVNYAKRVGNDYPMYRKYGSISFGLCAYGLGIIGTFGLAPDFVPAMVVYVVSMFLLMVLISLWPQEYFKIIPEGDQSPEAMEKLPQGKEILVHMRRNLHYLMLPRVIKESDLKVSQMELEERKKRYDRNSLSVKQQVTIFGLLLRRDYRIPLFLFLLTYTGLCSYAPQNFVFTYLNQRCNDLGTCNGSKLSGIVMLSYCFVETVCYMIINALRKHLNHGIVLSVTMASLSIHYYFFGFMIDHVSPYFFLVESLHGIEYATSLSSSIALGYRFGNEVELLIPELLEKKIVSENDDLELVKLSLMATMSGCLTLCHDGVGTIIGACLYGFLIEKISYTLTFVIIGTMATAGFFTIIFVMFLSKLLYIEPKIKKLAANKKQQVS